MYIYAANGLVAINEIKNNTETLYYTHTDHLGSLHTVTNASGIIVQSYTYDAWGKRTTNDGKPALFDRGFTLHEHLDEFKLINMNGRMYDPLLGRFLNVDPYVQAPENSQNYNRYSYCLNNPLMNTDPSGYLFERVRTYPTFNNPYPYSHISQDFPYVDSDPGGTAATFESWKNSSARKAGMSYYDYYQIYSRNNGNVEYSSIPVSEFTNFIENVKGSGNGRVKVQYSGNLNHFFEYDGSTGIFYIPDTDVEINPFSVLFGEISVYEQMLMSQHDGLYFPQIGDQVMDKNTLLGYIDDFLNGGPRTYGPYDVDGNGKISGLTPRTGIAPTPGMGKFANFKDFTSSNARKALQIYTGESGFLKDAHHIFPKKFEWFFNGKIDIHNPQNLTWWNSVSHRFNAAKYNKMWENWIVQNRNASPHDITKQGYYILSLFGL